MIVKMGTVASGYSKLASPAIWTCGSWWSI